MPAVTREAMDTIEYIRKLEKAMHALEKRHGTNGEAVLKEFLESPENFFVEETKSGELRVLKRESRAFPPGETATHIFKDGPQGYRWYPKQARDGAGRFK